MTSREESDVCCGAYSGAPEESDAGLPKTPSEHFNKLKAKYHYLTRESYDQLYEYYTNLTWDDIGEDEEFPDIPLPMYEDWKLSFIEDRLYHDDEARDVCCRAHDGGATRPEESRAGFEKQETPSKDEHFNRLKTKYDYLTRECYDRLYEHYTNLTWDDIGEDEDFPDIPLPMPEDWKLIFIEDHLRYAPLKA